MPTVWHPFGHPDQRCEIRDGVLVAVDAAGRVVSHSCYSGKPVGPDLLVPILITFGSVLGVFAICFLAYCLGSRLCPLHRQASIFWCDALATGKWKKYNRYRAAMNPDEDDEEKAPAKRPTLTTTGRGETLDSLLGGDDDDDDEDAEKIDLRLRSKSVPALMRESDKANDKLQRKSLVQLNKVSDDDEMERKVLMADLHEKWCDRPVDDMRRGMLKLEEAADQFSAKARHATDLANQQGYGQMAKKARLGVRLMQELIEKKAGDDALLQRYEGTPLAEIETKLEELRDELKDTVGASLNERVEKRLSTATKDAELMQAAIQKQRSRRVTLA